MLDSLSNEIWSAQLCHECACSTGCLSQDLFSQSCLLGPTVCKQDCRVTWYWTANWAGVAGILEGAMGGQTDCMALYTSLYTNPWRTSWLPYATPRLIPSLWNVMHLAKSKRAHVASLSWERRSPQTRAPGSHVALARSFWGLQVAKEREKPFTYRRPAYSSWLNLQVGNLWAMLGFLQIYVD